MPVIKPFAALKPAAHLQDSVVVKNLENYSLAEAKLIKSENEHSFLHLVAPELENKYLRGTRQVLIFKKIGENLEHFVDNKFLEKDQTPGIYIYRTKFNGLIQTGIWCLTHIKNYLDGTIKKHEHTVEKKERALAEYLQQTGLDANPVLITYYPNKVITAVISKYTPKKPVLDFIFTDKSQHQVWAITSQDDILALTEAFNAMDKVYIADGHHRIASMTKMGQQKAKLNKAHSGTESYNYFTSVYMDTNQVKVLEFNRLVRDIGSFTPAAFINNIEKSFDVVPVKEKVKPKKLHEIGMYLNGNWYILKPKAAILNDSDPVDVLDVSILQDYIFGPILNITDPRTDARLSFEGGLVSIASLQQQVDSQKFVIAFTMFPTSIKQLTDVADAGKVMPPKSTWVEPKFMVGLLTHCFS